MKSKHEIRWYEYLIPGAQGFRGLGKGVGRARGRLLAEVPVGERHKNKGRRAFATL